MIASRQKYHILILTNSLEVVLSVIASRLTNFLNSAKRCLEVVLSVIASRPINLRLLEA